MKNILQSFVPAAVASAFAVAAMVAFPLNAIASGSETTWTAGGGDEIGSNSYVLIASDIGESAEGWRCVAFSTADGGWMAAEGGVCTARLSTNLDDPDGGYRIECRDRASGLTVTRTLR